MVNCALEENLNVYIYIWTKAMKKLYTFLFYVYKTSSINDKFVFLSSKFNVKLITYFCTSINFNKCNFLP